MLDTHEKNKLILLIIGIFLMSLLDVMGVASIMPFMALLVNQDSIEKSLVVSWLFKSLEFENNENFLIFIGVCVFFIIILSLIIKALVIYIQTRFSLMLEFSVSRRLIQGYLFQPYEWFLEKHSANLGKNVLSEVGNVVHGGMLPLLNLIAQLSVVLAILGFLLVVDTFLAIGMLVILGSAYGMILFVMRRKIKHLGEERFVANQERYKAVSEIFGAIREVKLVGLEKIYTEKFSRPAETYAKGQTTAHIITQLPRYVLEAVAFGGMILIVLYLMISRGSFSDAIPIVSLYAFAGYRLMPALQQIYSSLTLLRFVGPVLDALHEDLIELSPRASEGDKSVDAKDMNLLRLEDVSYVYPGAKKHAIKNINIDIHSKKTVGIVGSTGSGKTTLVDLVAGLLGATSGCLIVDGSSLTATKRSGWSKLIGYVPQQIYLLDDTITANIALGVTEDYVNMSSIERVSKIANLHDFVTEKLERGYDTKIGERGVRLSGGQRQRIGIARALYRNPQILILDEATSALDNLTEQVVMDAVHNLESKITIIIVAHRFSTVRECDYIYMLEDGMIVAEGSYDYLIKNSTEFKKMAYAN